MTESSPPPATPSRPAFDRRRWGLRVLLAMVVVAAISQVPWIVGGKATAQAERNRAQLRETNDEIRQITARNIRLAGEVEALRTDVIAIENHARDELGMIYPGELLLSVERIAPEPSAP